jgi:RNA polymerase sigma-70 factor (ECF subfamily)
VASDTPGNQDFTKLYRRHRRRVHAWLTRSLGAVSDREDVMQEVFIQLFRALPTFRGAATIESYLFAITFYVSMDHLRKRGRQLPLSDGASIDEQQDLTPTPEELLRGKQQLEKLQSMVQILEEKLRTPFKLVILEGRSKAVVAERLGLHPLQVKRRVTKARRKLFKMLRRR